MLERREVGPAVRSYGQYCAVARALDVVGDRWVLLIVRELLTGARRYGELREGLPGIATNLLAGRLRSLEEAGVVERDAQGRYALTTWGEGLAEPVYALARWAAPVVMPRPAGSDAFRSEWLVHPVVVLFGGTDHRRPPMTVEVQIGESPMTLESRAGSVYVRPGAAVCPDVVLAGAPDVVMGLLAGLVHEDEAVEAGVSITGDAARLADLRPTMSAR